MAISHAIAYTGWMRAVLDTDVMVAAIRSDAGASRRLLVGGLRRWYTLVISVPLVIEYEAVMTRQEHLRASRLSTRDVTAILDAIVVVADHVRLAFLWRPLLRDPEDDMVLEAAVNGRADLLVTFNQRDFTAAARSFGLPVVLPRDALRRLGV